MSIYWRAIKKPIQESKNIGVHSEKTITGQTKQNRKKVRQMWIQSQYPDDDDDVDDNNNNNNNINNYNNINNKHNLT